MTPSLIFSAASGLAMVAWVALATSLFAAQMRPWVWRATGIAIPALLAVVYIGLLVSGWGSTPNAGFSSINEVRALFSNDALLTAGWLHYLAFDLFVGTWIAREGLENGISPFLIIPCLLFTFIFGPAGLLLFLGLRLFAKRQKPA